MNTTEPNWWSVNIGSSNGRATPFSRSLLVVRVNDFWHGEEFPWRHFQSPSRMWWRPLKTNLRWRSEVTSQEVPSTVILPPHHPHQLLMLDYCLLEPEEKNIDVIWIKIRNWKYCCLGKCLFKCHIKRWSNWAGLSLNNSFQDMRGVTGKPNQAV